MTKDPYRFFRVEARELAEQLARGVIDLEKGPVPPDLVPRLLRAAHTLKGAARVVKQPEVADSAHEIEEALGPLRDSGAAAGHPLVESVLGIVDRIRGRVAALSAPAPAPAPGAEPAATPAPPLAPAEPVRYVRTDRAELDVLLDGLDELGARLAALRQAVGGAEKVHHLAELVSQNVARPRPGVAASSARAVGLAEELRGAAGASERALSTGLAAIEREVRQVRESAELMRLVPVSVLFLDLERVVRDSANTLGKEARFRARGGEIRLGGDDLGVVQGALVQLARNAVAHGIEAAGRRAELGKPAEGTVALDVARRGRYVVFKVADDGAGLDLEAVRYTAERRGLLKAETGSLGAEQLVELLLRGGISTSGTVTQVAGRGIGLDVVREAASRLGASLAVRSEPGRGFTTELRVPVTRSALDALLVEAGAGKVALPLDAVRATTRFRPQDLTRTAEGPALAVGGTLLPFRSLSSLVARAAAPAAESARATAVVVEGGGVRAAFGVEALLGTGSVVLRPVPRLAPVSPVVAGASLDEEGRPLLVLDPDALVAAARGEGVPHPFAAPPRRKPILVVDDSMTTRILEQSILEAEGYEVDLAVSGEDGLEKALQRSYGLFLVDVEMPGMDGFGFLAQVQADPRLRDVPGIIVTSRDAPEDRLRAQKAGARGFVSKGDFDQVGFLEAVRRLSD